MKDTAADLKGPGSLSINVLNYSFFLSFKYIQINLGFKVYPRLLPLIMPWESSLLHYNS